MKISKKDRKKIIRSTIQLVFIILAFILIVRSIFISKSYSNIDMLKSFRGSDNGFIALSFAGVNRNGTETKINFKKLDEQLKLFKNEGYVTISQQDIQNYYNNNVILPEKSLFLIFEDGSRETAMYVQNLLEKYNYKATMLSYGDIFENKSSKFLSAKDMKNLAKTGYWEMGTNGYRFEYINYISDENYNHYLMDYIRDNYGVPLESYDGMKKRIEYDYSLMKSTYEQNIGYLPELYVLMHSDTGQYGTNNNVSDVNEKCIIDNFKIHFNNTNNPLNNKETSIYNLSRLTVNPNWSINYLMLLVNEFVEEN